MIFYLFNNLAWYFLVIFFFPFLFYLAFISGKWDGLRDFLASFSERQLQPLRGKDVVWIQAISLGEAKGVHPVIRELRERSPRMAIVVSVSSKAGYLWSKDNLPADLVIYSPLDFIPIVKKAFKALEPKALIIAESGFWPNLLHQAKRNGVFTFLIQGRMSAKSFARYRRFSFLSDPLFSSFDLICMQDKKGESRMQELGINRRKMLNSGTTKFDLLETITPLEKERLIREMAFDPAEKIILGASTHAGEEEAILETYQQIKETIPQLMVILAPRRLERISSIEKMISDKGHKFQKRSDILKGEKRKEPVILLDTIGELVKLYAFADLIFVGGSLVPNIGGHSLIEPLIYGKIPFHGPHMENQTEIKETLKEKGLSIEIKNREELIEKGLHFLQNHSEKETGALRALEFIKENQGYSEKIATEIIKIIAVE